MTEPEQSPGTPDWAAQGIPVDDDAEPRDQGVPHTRDDAAEAAR